MVNSLSNHTALVMDFPLCPKPRPTFQFCDIWARDPGFLQLIASITTQLCHTNPITKMKGFLKEARFALQKLNKNKFADLSAQLCKARVDLERSQVGFSHHPGDQQRRQKADMVRAHYTHILSSVIAIIRQQSKAEWNSYGDDWTKYFFAKIKQRKTATYIHSIQDDQG